MLTRENKLTEKQTLAKLEEEIGNLKAKHEHQGEQLRATLTEKELQELSVRLERDKELIALTDAVIGTLIQNYDSRDLLTHELTGILWGLSSVCIEWFPSLSSNTLLEELFNPIFRNEIPKLRRENPSDIHRLFQFFRAVKCCEDAVRLKDTDNLKRRDKAWSKVLEAFGYYLEISNGKPLSAPDFSKMGKAGAIKRHAPMVALQVWAVEKYHAKKWPSANKAAYDLKAQVIAYGRTIGAHLKEENAQRTIADWFRKESSR